MKVRIGKSSLKGKVICPPSKSVAHRMLISAGLAHGKSVIHGISGSDDMTATMNVLSALGAEFTRSGDTVTVQGCDFSGCGEPIIASCLECGSTLRFMVPIAYMSGRRVTLTGSERLMSRPLDVYRDIAKDCGLTFDLTKDSLTLEGNLPAREYYVPGNISSQFISGLLFALPLAKGQGESTIHVTPPLESAPYIDLTLDALDKYGIFVSRPDKYTFVIPSGQRYQPYSGDVEGDWSNAAFFIALKCLGFDVCVSGLNQNSLQGDRVCSDMIEKLTHGHTVISVSECPDIAPILMTVGALCHGVTLTDTSRLKIKESDRGEAMAQELYKLGVECEVYENKIVVPKCTLHAPTEAIDGHNDHRVVMAMATALLFLGGEITGAEAVRKSLPDYFEIIKSLGGEVLEIEA